MLEKGYMLSRSPRRVDTITSIVSVDSSSEELIDTARKASNFADSGAQAALMASVGRFTPVSKQIVGRSHGRRVSSHRHREYDSSPEVVPRYPDF